MFRSMSCFFDSQCFIQVNATSQVASFFQARSVQVPKQMHIAAVMLLSRCRLNAFFGACPWSCRQWCCENKKKGCKGGVMGFSVDHENRSPKPFT